MDEVKEESEYCFGDLSEELDFGSETDTKDFPSNYESPTQVTAEETVEVQTTKIPKEAILAHFRNIYENLQTKLCHLIEEGGLTLDETTLTFVLDMRANLTLCEGVFSLIRSLSLRRNRNQIYRRRFFWK